MAETSVCVLSDFLIAVYVCKTKSFGGGSKLSVSVTGKMNVFRKRPATEARLLVDAS